MLNAGLMGLSARVLVFFRWGSEAKLCTPQMINHYNTTLKLFVSVSLSERSSMTIIIFPFAFIALRRTGSKKLPIF